MKQIGVVGLGTMGLAIAANLLDKGYSVWGFDRSPERITLFEGQGGKAAKSAADVGQNVDAVIIMVFAPADLRDVILGKDGLIETLQGESTVIITASVGPQIILEIEGELSKKDIKILDAPVMADFNDAKAGRMRMLLSGEEAVIEKHRNMLSDMTSEIYSMGDKPGMAQAGKMCLQALFCLSFESGFEIIAMARSYGLNMKEMRRASEDSPASSVMLDMAWKFGAERIFENTFNPMSIFDKDIHIVLDMERDKKLWMPASEGTAAIYRKALEKWPKEDVWSAIKIVENEKETENE